MRDSPQQYRSISSRSGIRLRFIDAKTRTRKRGEGGGEAGNKVLGAYGRDVLNENGKLLLGFAEDNKLALLDSFLCTPKSGVPSTLRSTNRNKENQACTIS